MFWPVSSAQPRDALASASACAPAISTISVGPGVLVSCSVGRESGIGRRKKIPPPLAPFGHPDQQHPDQLHPDSGNPSLAKAIWISIAPIGMFPTSLHRHSYVIIYPAGFCIAHEGSPSSTRGLPEAGIDVFPEPSRLDSGTGIDVSPGSGISTRGLAC